MAWLRSVAQPAALGQLTARLARLTPDRPRRWGCMTAHQMAAHLADAADAALARRPFAAKVRPASGLTKALALRLPLPWPRGIRTGADPAAAQPDPDTFERERERAIATLEEIARAPATALARRHPIFGPMSRSDWHRWAFLHVDHHLRQFGL